MPFRLTRHSKILKPSDYKAVFNQGSMTRGQYWQIIAKKTESAPRLGLTISKKVHRLAVDRNRFKRIARESFRTHQDEFNHWDFVVMAKRAKPANNTVIAADLLRLFNKAINN